MKIAVTGHTAGIGAEFAKQLGARGHDIVGISKRDGYNIRNIPKITEMIVPCDFWINNAQAGFAQTELLYKVWDAWRNVPDKCIWLISTILTTDSGVINIPGMTQVAVAEYKNQKRALEDAFYQLKSIRPGPSITLIRPGAVATQPSQTPDVHGADVEKWVSSIIEFHDISRSRNLSIQEISLGFSLKTIAL